MPDNNISKAQPSKAKGLGGVFPLRSKNAALLYMYRCSGGKKKFAYCGYRIKVDDDMLASLETSSRSLKRLIFLMLRSLTDI